LRLLLRRWLRAQGATDLEVEDITIAVQEACTNAVEHAYGPGQATFELEATYAEGSVRIAVRDAGRWRAPRGTNRGRGLPIMQRLMDVVDIHQTDEGTEVVLERRVGGG
jgi:anti-sigma regulatory factor (Ser/Thr protein kinase)